jgi:TonB family protein
MIRRMLCLSVLFLLALGLVNCTSEPQQVANPHVRHPRSTTWACRTQNRSAYVISGTRTYPSSALLDFPQQVDVTVLVTVGPHGTVVNASIPVLSPFRDFNPTALRLAKAARYAPRIVNCKPVVGVVRYAVRFWSTESPTPAP